MLPIRSQKDLSILWDFGSFLVFLHVRKKGGVLRKIEYLFVK